ncbi:hypothetical protein AGMMS49949_02720 [Alphaproteobacteria bacterium]|nr:hypothetical protein AGMMS49949_02720 [Alphaproteobacteria bacterium]GHS96030.1 hypothetical protein AGMMS50296_1730 [Alphaproteobacteria bacterium]
MEPFKKIFLNFVQVLPCVFLVSCSLFKHKEAPTESSPAQKEDQTLSPLEPGPLKGALQAENQEASSVESSQSSLFQETVASLAKTHEILFKEAPKEPLRKLLEQPAAPPSLVKPPIKIPKGAAVFQKTLAFSAETLNELSQQLAGMTPFSNGIWEDEAKKAFCQTAEDGWTNLKTLMLTSLELWRKEPLAPFLPAMPRLFYPFGGPDATYALELFPHVDEYILVGLESTGTIQNTQGIAKTKELFDLLQKSMKNFFKRGYFITEYMAKDLSNKKNLGVLPVLLAQMVRLGGVISEIQEGVLTAEASSEMPKLDRSARPTFPKLKAIRIIFKHNNNKEKTLTYIRCELDNKNKEKLNILFDFVSQQNFCTLLKSASYALHNSKEFSSVRNFITRQSCAVLQDDTGIPFQILKKNGDVHLFGFYQKPAVEIFQKTNFQKDLAEAYKAARPKSLPFRLGYEHSADSSHLILTIFKTKDEGRLEEKGSAPPLLEKDAKEDGKK